MDPITIVVAALVLGAAAGTRDTASAAVKDAYAGLKALVKARLGGGADAELVLAGHEQEPQEWGARLRTELVRAGAEGDGDLVSAARTLLDLAEAASAAGKYTVDARGAVGVQVGDHNQQEFTVRQTPRDSTPGND